MPEDNKKQVEEFMQKIKEKKQKYQNVFESPDGVWVLEDLSKQAFINRTTFSEDTARMAFNEGQRSIILHIKSMTKIDIEKTQKAAEEQLKENDNV